MKKYFLIVASFFILIVILIGCKKKDEPVIVQKPNFSLKETAQFPLFDSSNAYNYVIKQLSFGSRNPNSKGHNEAKLFLLKELNLYADEVIEQNFNYPGYDEKLSLTNIIARFNPTDKNRIFFCAHWDSRPRADKETDSSLINKPIPGANDGASGVAILLELARILKENPVSYGIDLILFDGEDYGKENDIQNFCIGAKYFSIHPPNNFNPYFGILLDLVGDKEAVFYKEGTSINYAEDIVNIVWKIAQQIGAYRFNDKVKGHIYDDHVPLNQAGFKTINIIDQELVGWDMNNPRRQYWHTHKDDISNISELTLGDVGKVLVYLVYSLQFNL